MSFAFSLQLQQAIKQHREKSAHQAGRDNIDPELRSRENIADLFLTGDIPARGNTHRDFLQKRRKLQKMSKMPPVYMAPIPMWNPNTNQREVQSLAFLLPYDRVFAMAKWSNDPVCRHTRREQAHPATAHPVKEELLPQEWRNNPCYSQGPMREFSCMLAEFFPDS